MTQLPETHMADPLDALAEECLAVSEVVSALTEEDFARPVPRTSAWNIKELLAHMDRAIRRVPVGLDAPAPEAPDTDSVSYWRSWDPSEDSDEDARATRELAAGFPTGAAVTQAWDEGWRRAVARAGETDRTRIIKTWGPALTLDEFLRTRVLEVAVHRMDLEDALGRTGWGTDGAMSIVDDILVGLLGTEPPASLDWDVVDFVLAATGRRALTDAERKTLGRLAGRFPLLA